MSGSIDTSLPSDRAMFCRLIEGGGSTPSLPTVAGRVANCTARMPETTAYLLGLPAHATYAQGAAVIRQRWSDGRASH